MSLEIRIVIKQDAAQSFEREMRVAGYRLISKGILLAVRYTNTKTQTHSSRNYYSSDQVVEY